MTTLLGTETLQVLPVAGNGSPAATTETVTTAQIAALASIELPVTTGISANSAGTQASATQLSQGFNNVTTVGGSGYGVKLPASAAGDTIVVSNQGANAMQIFGTSPDTINGVATATGISVPVGAIFVFTCAVVGNWLQNVQTGGAFSGTFDGVLGGNTPAAATVTTLNSTTANGTTHNAGASGTAGTLNVFPATAANGKLIISAINNTGAFNSTITNKNIGQATVYSLPDAGAATTDLMCLAGAQTVTGQKTFVAPVLGAATATSINALTITSSTGTLTIPAAVTVTGPATSGTVALINPPPNAGGSTLAVSAAMSGKPILLDTAGGTTATLPAATGSGNKYKFIVSVSTTSAAHKILAASVSDYIIGNAYGYTGSTSKVFGSPAATNHSIQMPNSGSQPSGGIIGDVFDFVDIGANLWHCIGFYSAGTTPTTPFSSATS